MKSEDVSHDPLRPHAHDPNPAPPSADPAFLVTVDREEGTRLTPARLRAFPATTLPDCYIVSTGHGTSGPFAFTGASLLALVVHFAARNWAEVEVISSDGFGTRITAAELDIPDPARPIILAYKVNGRPLTRDEGLVRLIVPSETDDALRQVKWVARINVLSS